MKKSVILGIALLCMSFSTFAMDFSVGVTAGGLGPSFIRGEELKLAEITNSLFGATTKNNASLVFSPAVSANAVLEFIPYLGLEAGVGFGISKPGYKSTMGGEEIKNIYEFMELMIPIMLRFQLPVANFNIYAGVGANLNIVLSGKSSGFDMEEGKVTVEKMEKDEYAGFVVDLVFALGAEYAIAQKHFVGLRAQYNLGLMDRRGYEDGEKPSKALVLADALAFSLTYRYKF
ncbi:MAG: outer membrane beta-barrel protein [Treponemataceae bacterium]